MTAFTRHGETAPARMDPVHRAQQVFRCALDALASPGQPRTVPSALHSPLDAHPALGAPAMALSLALLDFETRVWMPAHPAQEAVLNHLRFACGIPVVDAPEAADVVLAPRGADLPPLERCNLGSDEQPERGATLILAVADFLPGEGPVWQGPGLAAPLRLDAAGLPPGFWAQRAALRELFPRGVDVFLASGSALVGLPRSTHLEA